MGDICCSTTNDTSNALVVTNQQYGILTYRNHNIEDVHGNINHVNNDPQQPIKDNQYKSNQVEPLSNLINQQSKHNQVILSNIMKQIKINNIQGYQHVLDFVNQNGLKISGHVANSYDSEDLINSKDIIGSAKHKQQRNKKQLQSKIMKPTNKYYCGKFNTGKAEGLAAFYHEGLYYYIGNFNDGFINGQGVIHYINQNETQFYEQYEGNFVDGKANGHGKYIKKHRITQIPNSSTKPTSYKSSSSNYNGFEDDMVFEGEWMMGRPISGSCNLSPSSNIRHLQILDIKTREGVLNFKNGAKYKGHLNQKLQPEGTGSYKAAQNSSSSINSCLEYEGEWQQGKYHGNGKFIWRSGETYEGSYVAGKKQGHGKYSYKKGLFYIGEWLEGLQNGRGILFSEINQVIKRGLWNKGGFVMDISEQQWKQQQ